MSQTSDRTWIEEREPANPGAGDPWKWTLANGDDPGAGPVALVWRWIPPGHFRMGARGYDQTEEPMHEVVVRHVFWMLETPAFWGGFRSSPMISQNLGSNLGSRESLNVRRM